MDWLRNCDAENVVSPYDSEVTAKSLVAFMIKSDYLYYYYLCLILFI